MKEVFVCEHCGAHSNKFWKRLSAGNVGALVKLRQAIGRENRNDIHIAQELDLSYSGRANFSTLRQHGLVAHIKDDAGNRVSGRWLLTARGGAFLRGELRVPARVQTMNNRVVDHDDQYMSVSDVLGSQPYFDDHYETERVPLNMAQVELF